MSICCSPDKASVDGGYGDDDDEEEEEEDNEYDDNYDDVDNEYSRGRVTRPKRIVVMG